jgi:2,4-dienoyl-CoA reductase-like NADH-dependent reductase (Old Yellow Enzyme family)
MWKPPERIKFFPSPGRSPSRQEAQAARLFSPIQLGPLALRHRTWVPAMVPWRSNEAGEVTEDVIQWYARFAQGRPGAIVVEATGIRDVPSGPLLRIGDDRYIDGLRRLTRAVHEASGGQTRLLIQIIDFLRIRRRPDPQVFFERHLNLSPALLERAGLLGLPDQQAREALFKLGPDGWQGVLDLRDWQSLQYGAREHVNDIHLPHIAQLPQELPGLFANAAQRAQAAGFDGVELHYAHAYTMASFLSATNQRSDGYGGSREQRVRLPLQVYAQVRAAVGAGYAVGCRFLADECIEGGSTVQDSTWYALQFALAGMDFLSTSRGGKFDDAKQPGIGQAAYPYTGRSGYECMPQYLSDAQGPFGRNRQATAQIRHTIRQAGLSTPVVCTGGVHNFEMAEAMLAAGDCDVVGTARQSLADPDWALKTWLGRGRDVRLCEYTNYCEGLDQKHKQVSCQLWDRQALDEPGVRMSQDGKRRLVAPAWQADAADETKTADTGVGT